MSDSRYFPRIDRWQLPASLLQACFDEMRLDGTRGTEGIALWLGTRVDGLGDIRQCVMLRGQGVRRAANQIVIESWLLDRVTDLAIGSGQVLIGQIHSHGPLAGTDLSFTDVTQGFRVPGYLSLVAPNYAAGRSAAIGACGVHVFELSGYRRLPSEEVEQRVNVGDLPWVGATVGDTAE